MVNREVWDGFWLSISLEVALKVGWGGFGQTSIPWIEIPEDTNFRQNGKSLIRMLLMCVKMLHFTISQQIIFLLEDSMMQWKNLYSWKDKFEFSLFHVLASRYQEVT